jgi:hypothetical protein
MQVSAQTRDDPFDSARLQVEMRETWGGVEGMAEVQDMLSRDNKYSHVDWSKTRELCTDWSNLLLVARKEFNHGQESVEHLIPSHREIAMIFQ